MALGPKAKPRGLNSNTTIDKLNALNIKEALYLCIHKNAKDNNNQLRTYYKRIKLPPKDRMLMIFT